LYDFAAENFVAGFHVAEVEVGAHVGGCCEPFVAYGVPEEQDAVGFAAHEAGAVNNIGKAVDEGFEE